MNTSSPRNKGLTHTVDVVLISMPFGPLLQPSLGLSLLRATLAPFDISSKNLYLTLRFVERIGVSLYNQLANGEPYGDLAGERIFADALFADTTLDMQAYIDEVLRRRTQHHTNRRAAPDAYIQQILMARDMVESYLDEMVGLVLSYSPKIVGFTSVFQQQVASLALAKRLKQRDSHLHILFGGANCEGNMGCEVIRQFPFVDGVVSGEGENVFPRLAQRILSHQSYDDLQGVYTANNTDLISVNGYYPGTPPVQDMNRLPIPDYSDFFEQLKKTALDELDPVNILFETSRGCWWGERQHCTFCGLNGATMNYRSKNAERAIQELSTLITRYPGHSVLVVDNILDMKYFKSFIPDLADKSWDIDLFYEVKANLSKPQLRLLQQAKIKAIQPGIESLHSHVLQLMRKGVSALQNVQLLKWCQELGIEPRWNMIWGFPGELPEDYAAMEKIIPMLFHLHPPMGSGTIRLDRFSPNFDRAQEMGFMELRPLLSYRYIYPLPEKALFNLAYHFDYSYREQRDVASYTVPVAQAITEWRDNYEESAFFMVDIGSHLLLWDFRPIGTEVLTILAGLERFLYLECDAICSLRQLQKAARDAGFAYGGDVEQVLESMVRSGMMLNEGNTYLSLAIPAPMSAPHPHVLKQFYETLEAHTTWSADHAILSLPVPQHPTASFDPPTTWFALPYIDMHPQQLVVKLKALAAYIADQSAEYHNAHLPEPIGGIIIDI